jgi:hypothetical protein
MLLNCRLKILKLKHISNVMWVPRKVQAHHFFSD